MDVVRVRTIRFIVVLAAIFSSATAAAAPTATSRIVSAANILLSRTHGYRFLRIGGAAFAGSAALGWVGERLFGLHTSVDAVVSAVAHYAVWIAGALFSVSLLCWSLRKIIGEPVPNLSGCEPGHTRPGYLFASGLAARSFARDEKAAGYPAILRSESWVIETQEAGEKAG